MKRFEIDNEGVIDFIKEINDSDKYYDGYELLLPKLLIGKHNMGNEFELSEVTPKHGDEFCAALIKHDDKKWEILINKESNTLRKRFSVVHEYAHFISYLCESYSESVLENGKKSILNEKPMLYKNSKSSTDKVTTDYSYADLEADEIAGCLLMPEAKVYKLYKQKINITDMAYKFQVSESTMTVRIHNLGLGIMWL